VDHILRISAGGDPWDMRNLDSKCHACHSLKTNAEKSGKAWVGHVGKDGLPVGGDHWWGSVQCGNSCTVEKPNDQSEHLPKTLAQNDQVFDLDEGNYCPQPTDEWWF
jgi:hypothetical protein